VPVNNDCKSKAPGENGNQSNKKQSCKITNEQEKCSSALVYIQRANNQSQQSKFEVYGNGLNKKEEGCI